MGSAEHEIEDVIFIANHTSCKYSDDTIELLTALSPIRSVGVCHRLACNNHTSSGSVRVTHIVTSIIFLHFISMQIQCSDFCMQPRDTGLVEWV